MIKQLPGMAYRSLPNWVTTLGRRIIPNESKIWLRNRLSQNMSQTQFVKSKDGRTFKTISDGLFFRVHSEGIYEPELTEVFREFIRPNDKILDVGGNFGWYATLFGEQASNGKVYSFEPVPDTFEVLKENIVLNGLDDVISAERVCVGCEEGTVPFARTDNSGLGHVATEATNSEDTVDTQIITLNSRSDEYLNKVALIKVHVEGFELDVLKGANSLLSAEVQPVVQVKLTDQRLARYGVHRNDIFELLKSHELELYELKSDGKVRANATPVTHEIFGVGQGQFADRFRELYG